MKNIASKVWCLLKGEEGVAAVEYAVMLSLIVGVCLASISHVGRSSNSVFLRIASVLAQSTPPQ